MKIITNFFKYILRPVQPVPGDIELKAVQWHFFHFAVSFIITLFIGSIFEWITNMKDGYTIAAGVLFAYFLVEEIKTARYNPRIDFELLLYKDDFGTKYGYGIEYQSVIYAMTHSNAITYVLNSTKHRIFKKYPNNVIETYIEYTDPWAEIKDSFTDLNQYASCFIVPLWAYGAHLWALGLLGVILTVYVATIKWCKP